MKKIFIVVWFIVAVIVFADGLNEEAQKLKDNHPTVYAPIHERALRIYDDNYMMVLFEINRQSSAFYKALKMGLEDEPLFLSIYVKWVEDIQLYNANQKKLLEIPCDWGMIEWELTQQMGAKALLNGGK